MSAPSSVRQAYDRVLPELEELRDRALPLIEKVAEEFDAVTHSRIKDVESLCLKMERGDNARPLAEMEDLLAAMVVVPRSADIPPVQQALGREFHIVRALERRTQDPESFGYDEACLILQLREDDRDGMLRGGDRALEVQIKSLVQHALGVVTHRAVYKPRRESWRKTRLAAQLRADLELVDELLEELLEASDEDPDEPYALYRQRNAIARALEAWWRGEPLTDARRAALIIEKHLQLADVHPDDLPHLLSQPQAVPYSERLSVTPTQAVLMALFTLRRDAILANLQRKRARLLIVREMLDACPDLDAIPDQNRVVLDA